MNRLQLFCLLRRNNRLSYRRSPAFEQSVVAKVIMLIGAGFAVIYLVFLGVLFASIANDSDLPGIVMMILPLFLLIDFGLRFTIQQTPVMLMRPYILLPMSRYAVIDTFLLTSVFSGWNLLWLSLFLPYFIITMAGGATFVSAFSVLLAGMVLVMANSQWYLLIRTLVARSLLWWLIPIVVYALYFVPLLMLDCWKLADHAIDTMAEYGSSYLTLFGAICWLAALLWLNRNMQFRFVYEEIAREQSKDVKLKSVSRFAVLENFGQVGEYLKLEIKSIMRNKAIRSRVMMSLGLVVMLSVIITFTDIYDGFIMLNFWCFYCFSIYGMTALVKIMGPEGNYIDLLMVHRENILSLLKAKYYFHCAILIVPLVIMIPAVINEKFSILMMTAHLLLSSGMLYFIMFQLAVYNKQTLPLDQKLTGKGNVENGLQLALEMLGMFLPIILVAVFLLIFDEIVAYIMLITIGLIFTLLHPLWLRNVYERMMKRKYENLEGFHVTR